MAKKITISASSQTMRRLEVTSHPYGNEDFHGIGNGAVIWLENGKSVHAVLYPTVPGTDLHRETMRVFGDPGGKLV
jgi:hypothetical protein